MVMEIVHFPPNFDIQNQSRELPGTKRPGQTGAFVHQVWSQEHPIDYGVHTLPEAFDSGLSRGAQRECLGHRPLIPGSNPPQRERRYVWQNFGEVDARRRDLGSALFGMFRDGRIGGGDLPTVGIWANNVPEWQIIDFSIHLYGLVNVALYESLGPDAVEYVINHSETTIAFATPNHLPSLLKLAGTRCPKLKVLVSMDPLEPQGRAALDAWGREKGVQIFEITELEAMGRKNRIEPPKVTADQIASICYTSGTTANPKGAVLTHRGILAGVSMMLHGSDLDPTKVTVISYLPLAHIYGRIVEMLAISVGGRIGFFGGDTQQLLDDLQMLKPDYLPSVPRVLNKIYASIMAQTSAPGLKGVLLRQAIAAKVQRYRETGNTDHAFWDALVFRKVRAALGGNLAGITSGSAPVSKEVFDLIKVAFGGKVVEGYGMTETNATITRTVVQDPTGSGLAGFPHAFTQIKLVDVPDMGYTSEDKPHPRGEIYVKSDACIKEYYKDPENTKKLIDPEGWLRTGDVALLDSQGRFKIIDRVKNIMKLAQGEYIGLERIENAYSSCPMLQQIYVYATSLREYIVGIVVPDYVPFAALVEKATGDKVKPDDRAGLERAARDPRVVEAFLRVLERDAKKAGLKGFEQVKNLHIELEPFSVENGLLTPTFKARRRDVDQKYAPVFEALYARGPVVPAAKPKL